MNCYEELISMIENRDFFKDPVRSQDELILMIINSRAQGLITNEEARQLQLKVIEKFMKVKG